jgi:tetratricopeptide (TPR) repeat protein
VDSLSVLRRLVNMMFVRKDELVFTQFSLLHRGADYFKEARMSRENWKTIDDLSAHIAEFDLRCAGQEYDTAAVVLREIDFDYLLLWGHYRVMAELHERLQGKLSDPRLKSWSASNLGNAYHLMGDYQKAIEYHERALAIAKENSNRQSEGIVLGNLGVAYISLGQVQTAIDYYEQSLKIARKTGTRQLEENNLGNLGLAYISLGQVQTAIDYYKQALEIAREIGDRGEKEINSDTSGMPTIFWGRFRQQRSIMNRHLRLPKKSEIDLWKLVNL